MEKSNTWYILSVIHNNYTHLHTSDKAVRVSSNSKCSAKPNHSGKQQRLYLKTVELFYMYCFKMKYIK